VTLPTTCILAGGLGTRLGERVRDVPKPLIEVAGQPFLLHQLRLLAGAGAADVVLCVGYRGDAIEEAIGHKRYGIDIAYSHDAPGLEGTLGAIRRAAELLPERFLTLYGDTYLRVDYAAAAAAWLASGCRGLMTVFRNDNRWDRSNLVLAGERVVAYDKKQPRPEMQWIDYGLGGLARSALQLVSERERDLSALQSVLARRGELYGYEAKERFYEIGTPEALAETEAFLASN
jgi:N-acetyl-alpha-D-muramate 1-phosphate uridylyltransferase